MADRPSLLNLEPLRFSPAAVSQLSRVTRYHQGPLSRTQLLRQIASYDILWVRLHHRIDEEVLQSAVRLRTIVSPTTGLNHIDLNQCRSRGITVLSLKNEQSFLRTVTATAEHALGLTLAIVRHTAAASQQVSLGHWNRDAFIGRQLSQLTLGIVGMGRLGRIMARIAHPLFHQIVACDPAVYTFPAGVQRVSFKDVLRRSDVISIHASLTPQSQHLFNTRAFQQMKRGAYLINTSRGAILDEAALLKALKSGHLSGAALDVLEQEHQDDFIPRDNPIVRYARLHRNLLITPHLGGATRESMDMTELHMAERLCQHLRTR